MTAPSPRPWIPTSQLGPWPCGSPATLLAVLVTLASAVGAAPDDPPGHTLNGGVPLLFEANAAPVLSANQVARNVVAEGGRAFVAAVSAWDITAGRAHVVRVDPGTGQVLWEHMLPGNDNYYGTRVPLAADAQGGRVFTWEYVGGAEPYSSMRAIDGADGSLVWEVGGPEDVGFIPAAMSTAGGLLTAASYSVVLGPSTVSLEGRVAADGALLWRDAWAVVPMAAGATHLVTTAMSDNGSRTAVAWTAGMFEASPSPEFGVRVYDTATGQLDWRAVTGPGPMTLSPDGSVVATTDGQGSLVALDGATGAPLWRANVSGMVRSVACDPSSRTLFAAVDEDPADATTPTRITAFRLRTGAALWSVLEEPWGPGVNQIPVQVEVAPDGSRVALYLNGGQPLVAKAEGMAVLFDASSGARLGALAPAGGNAAHGGGAFGAMSKLAFDLATDQVLVVGNDPWPAPGPTGRDVLIDRIALANGAQLPRFEFDVLIPAGFKPSSVVFDEDGETVVFAGEATGLSAYLMTRAHDVATGALKWERLDASPSPGWSGVGVDLERGSQSGTLFAVDGFSVAPVLRALDPDDGAELWSQPFPNSQNLVVEVGLESSPDSSLLLATVHWVDADVAAFDGDTGALLWDEFKPASLDRVPQGCVDVAVNGRVFLAGFLPDPAGGVALRVAELDGATGATQWTWTHGPSQDNTIDSAVPFGITMLDGVVYVLESTTSATSPYNVNSIRALDAATGAELYQVPVTSGISGGELFASPELGLVVAVVSTSNSYFVMGIVGATSQVVYSQNVSPKLIALQQPLSKQGGPTLSDDGSTLLLTGSAAGDQPYSFGSWAAAVDCATGDVLWSAEFGDAAQGYDVAASPTGNAAAITTRLVPGNFGVVYGTPVLIAAPDELSLSFGGSQKLKLVAGTARAGDWHFVVGSMTGTAPGTPLGGFTLPLNADAYLFLTAASPGAPVAGALGVLSTSGMATAEFQLPAGASPSLAGLELNHAFATIRFTAGVPAVTSVSNAVPVLLGP